MTVYAIEILDNNLATIALDYKECWYQEEAEAIARKACEWLGGYTWQVIPIMA